MGKDLIAFDAEGQQVLNWDSLELKTSREFVEAIQPVYDDLLGHTQKLWELGSVFADYRVAMEVDDDESCKLLVVELATGSEYHCFIYGKNTGDWVSESVTRIRAHRIIEMCDRGRGGSEMQL